MQHALDRSRGELEFPSKFQGVFARRRPALEPLIVEAREQLRAMPVPPMLKPYYAYGVLEHAQPSFVLAPLMFLAMAEDQGGITQRHKDYLPAFLLMVELIGILDDTVDHSPQRSGRMTYWRRFGAASAAPFSCFLFSAAVEQTMASAPELLPLVTGMFNDVCASESWEHDSRYPEVSVASLTQWLRRHYDAVPRAISHSLDSALLLHGREPLDAVVCERFAELQQDVDDLVNFVERRETEGENDDLKMGIVTYPLLATVEAEPSAAALLEALWAPLRSRAAREGTAPLTPSVDTETFTALSTLVHARGVRATIEKIGRDADAAIAAARPEVRACVADMVWTFVERLCRVESLRADVERCCPSVVRVR